MEETYSYQKLNDDGKVEYAPNHDPEGKITGLPIIGVKAWFDEHPEERKALGWIKHIHPSDDDVEFNEQTQYIMAVPHHVDPYTIVDEYVVVDKSEDQLILQEMGVHFGNFIIGNPHIIIGG